jgi:hypothetical protein
MPAGPRYLSTVALSAIAAATRSIHRRSKACQSLFSAEPAASRRRRLSALSLSVPTKAGCAPQSMPSNTIESSLRLADSAPCWLRPSRNSRRRRPENYLWFPCPFIELSAKIADSTRLAFLPNAPLTRCVNRIPNGTSLLHPARSCVSAPPAARRALRHASVAPMFEAPSRFQTHPSCAASASCWWMTFLLPVLPPALLHSPS